MLRLLIWLMVGFIVFKMVRLASSIAKRPRDPEAPEAPFVEIQDAQFEDLSDPPAPEAPGGEEKSGDRSGGPGETAPPH